MIIRETLFVKFSVDHSQILFNLIFSTSTYVTLVTFANDTNMGGIMPIKGYKSSIWAQLGAWYMLSTFEILQAVTCKCFLLLTQTQTKCVWKSSYMNKTMFWFPCSWFVKNPNHINIWCQERTKLMTVNQIKLWFSFRIMQKVCSH